MRRHSAKSGNVYAHASLGADQNWPRHVAVAVPATRTFVRVGQTLHPARRPPPQGSHPRCPRIAPRLRQRQRRIRSAPDPRSEIGMGHQPHTAARTQPPASPGRLCGGGSRPPSPLGNQPPLVARATRARGGKTRRAARAAGYRYAPPPARPSGGQGNGQDRSAGPPATCHRRVAAAVA